MASYLIQQLYRLKIWIQTCIAHILAYLFSLLRSLTHSSSSPPYPYPSSCTVSPQWLTHVLREKKVIEERVIVERVEITEFSAAGGAGSMKKLCPTYKDEQTGKGVEGPKSFALKMNRPTLSARHITVPNRSFRENHFYSHPYSSTVSVPAVYYTYESQLLGEYLLLMEDLTNRQSFAKVGAIFGNQCWGLAGNPPPPFDPFDTLQKIFLNAAEFHARCWRDETLLSQDWLNHAQWYQNKNRIMWELGLERARRSWVEIKAQSRANSLGFDLSPKLEKIIDKSLQSASWANLLAHLHDPKIPWSLCHGDFHAGNMILAGEELILVDWTQVGPWEPTTDLAQTIISDVKPELFMKHTNTLVRNYWEKLISLGISDKEYPFSLCWERFCKGGAERWIYLFVVLAGYGMPTGFVKYSHDQLLSFIESHGDYDHYVLKPVICIV